MRQSTQIQWWRAISNPEYVADPYPFLEEMRAAAPVHHDADTGDYFILGHAAFNFVLRSKALGRDNRLWNINWDTPQFKAQDPVAHKLFSEFQPQMINVNPPDHRRMRGVYERMFTPGAVGRMRELVQGETDALLDAMPRDGVIDLMGQFAKKLPFHVILRMFDVPRTHDRELGEWSEALQKLGEFITTPEERKAALDALLSMKAFLKDFVDHRRTNPGKGLIDIVIAAGPPAGDLDEDETLTNLTTMLIAGHETTVGLMGNAMFALLNHPEQMALLRRQPELLSSMIEEALRFEPGGFLIHRVANEDVEVEGYKIPKGSGCFGILPATNRDPAVFDNPNVFDITRSPNAHLSFGGGAHYCLGAPLARLEGAIAYQSLLERYGHIEWADAPTWLANRINNHCLKHFPLKVRPA